MSDTTLLALLRAEAEAAQQRGENITLDPALLLRLLAELDGWRALFARLDERTAEVVDRARPPHA